LVALLTWKVSFPVLVLALGLVVGWLVAAELIGCEVVAVALEPPVLVACPVTCTSLPTNVRRSAMSPVRV
jgi:hypothetical protein